MRVIDLSGPMGNAFALLGLAEQYARQLDYERVEVNRLMEEMQSSDYDNLVAVFEEHFGDYVELVNG